MVYNKAKWIAAVKKAVADLKMEGKPTSGKPCAIAALRYVRDAILDDIGPAKLKDDGTEDEASFAIAAVKESVNELIKALSPKDAKVEDGFLSNASAAAKAAGFKGDSGVAGIDLDE